MANRFALSSLVIILFFALSGCSSSDIDLVKSGTLKIDKSITVGDAFKSYPCFGKSKWSEFTADKNRKIVEFRTEVILEDYPGLTEETRRIFSGLNVTVEYIVQFHINKDGKTFGITYAGYSYDLPDNIIAGFKEFSDGEIDLKDVKDVGIIPNGIVSVYKEIPSKTFVSDCNLLAEWYGASDFDIDNVIKQKRAYLVDEGILPPYDLFLSAEGIEAFFVLYKKDGQLMALFDCFNPDRGSTCSFNAPAIENDDGLTAKDGDAVVNVSFSGKAAKVETKAVSCGLGTYLSGDYKHVFPN